MVAIATPAMPSFVPGFPPTPFAPAVPSVIAPIVAESTVGVLPL